MPIAPMIVLQLALLGLFAGFWAGLLGVGGGLILVPFMAAFATQSGLEPALALKVAIATSMATIVFTSMSSVRAHHRKGAVRWDLVARLAPGIVLGALAASMGVFSRIRGGWLYFLFALFVAFSGTRMLLARQVAGTRQLPGTAGLLGAGGVIGFLSGLVGAGGGFISVPFMTWCSVPIHNAVATSAGLGFPIALANTLGFMVSGQGVEGLPPYSIGYVWVPALAAVAVCSVLTAPLGARAAHALPVKQLKRAFALMLYALAIYMFRKGLAAM